MANCSKCGESLIGSAKFCAACGAPNVTEVAPPASLATAPQPQAPTNPAPPLSQGAPLPPLAPPMGAPSARKAGGPKGTELMASPAPPPMQALPKPLPPPSPSRTPPPPPPPPAAPVDPLAATAGRDSYGPPPPAPQAPPVQGTVSPFASSIAQQGFGAPQYGAAPAPPQYGAAPAPQYGGAPAAQYGAPPSPYGAPGVPGPSPFAPQPQAMQQFGAGARVLVQWADGNRYPATVQQSAGAQCLVVFPNGQQQWVDAQYLSMGA